MRQTGECKTVAITLTKSPRALSMMEKFDDRGPSGSTASTNCRISMGTFWHGMTMVPCTAGSHRAGVSKPQRGLPLHEEKTGRGGSTCEGETGGVEHQHRRRRNSVRTDPRSEERRVCSLRGFFKVLLVFLNFRPVLCGFFDTHRSSDRLLECLFIRVCHWVLAVVAGFPLRVARAPVQHTATRHLHQQRGGRKRAWKKHPCRTEP